MGKGKRLRGGSAAALTASAPAAAAAAAPGPCVLPSPAAVGPPGRCRPMGSRERFDRHRLCPIEAEKREGTPAP